MGPSRSSIMQDSYHFHGKQFAFRTCDWSSNKRCCERRFWMVKHRSCLYCGLDQDSNSTCRQILGRRLLPECVPQCQGEIKPALPCSWVQDPKPTLVAPLAVAEVVPPPWAAVLKYLYLQNTTKWEHFTAIQKGSQWFATELWLRIMRFSYAFQKWGFWMGRHRRVKYIDLSGYNWSFASLHRDSLSHYHQSIFARQWLAVICHAVRSAWLHPGCSKRSEIMTFGSSSTEQ